MVFIALITLRTSQGDGISNDCLIRALDHQLSVVVTKAVIVAFCIVTNHFTIAACHVHAPIETIL
ncbi:hypothetical protein KA405_02575 [Patescibacteria group bacterium]|nr:hypothetical protein [Patescibacteria group bacterium]